MRFELTGVLPPLVFKTSALNHSAMLPYSLAEEEGFEPSDPLRGHYLSRVAVSATHAPFRRYWSRKLESNQLIPVLQTGPLSNWVLRFRVCNISYYSIFSCSFLSARAKLVNLLSLVTSLITLRKGGSSILSSLSSNSISKIAKPLSGPLKTSSSKI